MTHDEMLAYYAAPGPFTAFDASGGEVDALPSDIETLVATVQNLLIHRFWAQAYNLEVPPEREREQGVRSAEGTIACAMRRRQASISEPRSIDDRALGVCRHFAVMLTAFLRRKGIPARARCGFSSYFEAGKYVDHWVCEYWRSDEARWVMVDAQLDALQRRTTKPDFDPLDVPQERFWVAGQAWQRVRRGEADGANFGIADMWGDWFIVGDVTLDALALQKLELLPWEPVQLSDQRATPAGEALRVVDQLATLAQQADAPAMSELQRITSADARFRLPQSRIEEMLREEAAGATTGNPIHASVDGAG